MAAASLSGLAEFGDLQAIESFLLSSPSCLERKILINTQNEMGWTALHQTAVNGYHEVAELLLKHGADPTISNQNGETALHLAARYGFPSLCFILIYGVSDGLDELAMGSEEEEESESVDDDKSEEQELHIEEGEPFYPEHVDDEFDREQSFGDRTPINTESDSEIEVEWVEDGLVVSSTPNRDGELREESSHFKESDEDLKETDQSRVPYPSHSLSLGHDSTENILSIEENSPKKTPKITYVPLHPPNEKLITSKNNSGRTPLFIAVMNKRKRTTEMLLLAGSDPNAQDDIYWTPLHYASRLGFGSLVEILLKNGANFEIPNGEDKLPLDVALNFNIQIQIRGFIVWFLYFGGNQRNEDGEENGSGTNFNHYLFQWFSYSIVQDVLGLLSCHNETEQMDRNKKKRN